jgi:hypothetical protein
MFNKFEFKVVSYNYYYLVIILNFILKFTTKNKYDNIILEFITNVDPKKLEEYILDNYKKASIDNKDTINKVITKFNASIDIKNYQFSKFKPQINTYYLFNIVLYLLDLSNKAEIDKSIELFYEYYIDIIYNKYNLNILNDIDKLKNQDLQFNYFKIILFSLLSTNEIFDALFNNTIHKVELLIKQEEIIVIKYLYIINNSNLKLIDDVIKTESSNFIDIYQQDNYLIKLIFDYYIKYLENKEFLTKQDNDIIKTIINNIIYILDKKFTSITQTKLDYILSNINKINYLLYDTIIIIKSIKSTDELYIEKIIDFSKMLIRKKYDYFEHKNKYNLDKSKPLATLDADVLDETIDTNTANRLKLIKKFSVEDIKLYLIDIALILKIEDLILLNNLVKDNFETNLTKSYIRQSTFIEENDFNIKNLHKYSYNFLLVILSFIYKYYYTKKEIVSKLDKYIYYIGNIELRINLKKEIETLYKKMNKKQIQNLNSKLLSIFTLLKSDEYSLSDIDINLNKQTLINVYLYLCSMETYKFIIDDLQEIDIMYNNSYCIQDFTNKILINLIDKLNDGSEEYRFDFITSLIILTFINEFNKSSLDDNSIFNKLCNNYLATFKSTFGLFNYIKYLFLINNRENDIKFSKLDIETILTTNSDTDIMLKTIYQTIISPNKEDFNKIDSNALKSLLDKEYHQKNEKVEDIYKFLISYHKDLNKIFEDIYKTITNIPNQDINIESINENYRNKDFKLITEGYEKINEENEYEYNSKAIYFIKYIVFYCIEKYLNFKKLFNRDELNKITTTLDNILYILEYPNSNYKENLKTISDANLNYALFNLLIFFFDESNINDNSIQILKKILKTDKYKEYSNDYLINKFIKRLKQNYYKNKIDDSYILNITINLIEENYNPILPLEYSESSN